MSQTGNPADCKRSAEDRPFQVQADGQTKVFLSLAGEYVVGAYLEGVNKCFERGVIREEHLVWSHHKRKLLQVEDEGRLFFSSKDLGAFNRAASAGVYLL